MTRIAAVMSALAVAAAAAPASGQEIEDVRYDVFYDVEASVARQIHVEMSFDAADTSVVSLSLPAWTPGSYSLDDFARNVRNVWAREGDAEIDWDKSDWDTWRVYPTGAGRVTIGFDYAATAFDTGSSWAGQDFAFFNGTNLFLFPDGGELDFPSEVVFHTEPDWRVATGMTARSDREYVAQSYHELVDMPTFVGRFDLDSLRIGEVWHRVASYPEGALQGEQRTLLWDQLQRMMPVLEAVTDRMPFEQYTTMLVFDAASGGGGSALEHANSHLGLYSPAFRGTPVLASITAHEIFHAWNVKRMRPAGLWPYDYARPMPTDLLWVSEGITDYYADLALVRGAIVSPEYFLGEIQAKIEEVAAAPPVALEDASLSTWISRPTARRTSTIPRARSRG